MKLLNHECFQLVSGGKITFDAHGSFIQISLEYFEDICIYEGFTLTYGGCFYNDKLVLPDQVINSYQVIASSYYFGSYYSETGVRYTFKPF